MRPKLKVTGGAEIIKKLARFGIDSENEISKQTQLAAESIKLDATERAPVNLGKLKQSINAQREGKTLWSVFANEQYAAYVEFGTGAKVDVPDEFKDIANAYRGKGDGGNFKQFVESLKDWCRKKGIPESAAYLIAVSILKNGMSAQPFLYPAWKEGIKQYEKDLKDLLQYLTDKYNK